MEGIRGMGIPDTEVGGNKESMVVCPSRGLLGEGECRPGSRFTVFIELVGDVMLTTDGRVGPSCGGAACCQRCQGFSEIFGQARAV